MTQIDFYLLAGSDPQARERLACRLAEKIYKMDLRLYIHTAGPAHSQQLDELLWTFRAGSFVPHELDEAQAEGEPQVAVRIGHHEECAAAADVLINLAPQVPLFFSRFPRVAEIVDQDPERRRQGRERYRFYRDRGYPLKTHELPS